IVDALVAGVGVDRGHQATLDAEGVVHDLGQRCQAVCGARSVGDDGVLLRVVVLVVDSHDEGGVDLLARCGEQHLLHAGLEVTVGLLVLRELAGALHDDVHAGFGPRDGCRIRLREGADGLLADAKRVLGVQYRLAEASHDGVVLQQVRQGGVVGQVVDRDDVEVRVHLAHRAEEAAPHAAEAVDADVDFLLVASWHACCPYPFASSVPWARCRRMSSAAGGGSIGRGVECWRLPVPDLRDYSTSWKRSSVTAAWVSGMSSASARLSAIESRRRMRPATASFVIGGDASWPSSSREACRCLTRSWPASARWVGTSSPRISRARSALAAAATAARAERRRFASSKLARRFAVARTSRRMRRSSHTRRVACAPISVSSALIDSASLTTTRCTPRVSRVQIGS